MSAQCTQSPARAQERPRPWVDCLLSVLAEDIERKRHANVPDPGVHDLVDLEVTRQAAEQIGVLAPEAVLLHDPGDHVPDGDLRPLHQVGVDAHRGVIARGISGSVCAGSEAGPGDSSLPKPKPEARLHWALDPGHADLTVALRSVRVAA